MAEANGNATSRSTQNASPASASRQLLKLNPSSKMFFGKKKNSVLHLLFTGNCIKMDLFVKKSDGEGCDIKSVSISYRDLSAFRYYIADSQVKSQFSLFALEPKFEPYKRLSQWSNQTMGVVVPENFLMMQFKSLSISQMEVIFRLVKASLGELKAANILIPLSNSYAKAYLLTPNRASGRTNAAISTESSNKVTFFESEELSDFKVIVDGKSINVHKYVLASRSPVFRVMLGHTDTVEARENKVDIPDIPHDIMKVFLEFLYTGVKPEDDQLSLDLLVVADKYQVTDLKLLCEDHLAGELTVENVVDVFEQAYLHDAKKLKAFCLEFFNTDYSRVFLTDKWKQMIKIGGDKVLEVLQAIRKPEEE